MAKPQPMAAAAQQRLRALSNAHQEGVQRFSEHLREFRARGMMNDAQVEVIEEHLIRLGERGRNPANTGNLEDLFAYTLEDTKDVIRAFAQALADSVKVVPMDPEAKLNPPLRSVETGEVFSRVADLAQYNPGDQMLIAHTMVAFGDEEMLASSGALVRASRPDLDEAGVEREVAKMAVQSQHGPSSTFILARMHGLTLELAPLYRSAGYDEAQIADAQRFYDICAAFAPEWAPPFLDGVIPETQAFRHWRANYLESRAKLPMELIYQLSSDTLTNFLAGTLESGKWTDASVYFGQVDSPDAVPPALARIVNQYIAEHIALHDRPAEELVTAVSATLAPWGVGFEDGRAVPMGGAPTKSPLIRNQFEAARARKHSTAK